MPNATRRRKKNKARGRVATPGQLIPGVPAYHQGTIGPQGPVPVHGQPGHPPDSVPLQGSGSTPPGGTFPGGRVENDYTFASEAQLQAWADAGDQRAIQELNNFFGGYTPTAPSTTSGSVGKTQFELDLLERRAELEDRIQAEIENANRLDRTSEEAIASGNRLSIERVELQKREAEAALLRYNQERDTLDRQLQEYQLSISQRGQDITQRGQNIDAQLTQNSQQIQRYQAELQAAQISGDATAVRDAEARLRGAQQQTAAIEQYRAALSGSSQQLQAQVSGGQQLGSLAGLEQQRQGDLIGLSQDPRDFMGLLASLGQGTNFLDQLRSGQPITGQSATTGISPLRDFGTLEQIQAQIGQTPAFDAAFAASQGLGQFQPPAAPSMQDILGLGVGPGGVSAPPAIPSAPQLNLSAPGAVPGLGIGGELTPTQRAIFDQFRAAAPNIPLDIAMRVARDPAAFRQLFEGLAPGSTVTPPFQPPGQPPVQPPPTNPYISPATPPGYENLYGRLVPSGIMSQVDWDTWLREGATSQNLFDRLTKGGVSGGGLPMLEVLSIIQMIPQGGLPAPTGGTQKAGFGGGTRTGGIGTTGGIPFGPGFVPRDLFGPTIGTPPPPQLPSSGLPPSPTGAVPTPGTDYGYGPGGTPYGPGFQPGYQFYGSGITLGSDDRLVSRPPPGYDPATAAIPSYVPPIPWGEKGGTAQQVQAFIDQPDVRALLGPRPVYEQDLTRYARQPNELGQLLKSGLAGGLLPPPPGAVNAAVALSDPGALTRGLSDGGELVVDEPSVLLGLRSGRAIATMGEPTAKYPRGIPELIRPNGNGLDVIPALQHGGELSFNDKVGGDDDLQIQPITPLQPVAPVQPLPAPDVPAPAPTSPFGPGVTPNNPGGAPVEPLPAQPTQLTPGELLRNLFSLSPESYYGMLPSQQDILFAIGRSLGLPRADAQASIERSFPAGLNPARILTAGFSGGGRIRFA